MNLKRWAAAAVITLGLVGLAAPAFATTNPNYPLVPGCDPETYSTTIDVKTDKDGTPTNGTVFGIRPDGGVAIGTPDNPSKVWAKWVPDSIDPEDSRLINFGGSYKTFRYAQASDPSAVVLPSYQLEVWLSGSSTPPPGWAGPNYTTLVYEPYQAMGNAAVHTGEWQTWTVNGPTSKLWSTHVLTQLAGDNGQATPETIEALVTAYPLATIISWGVNQGTYNAGGLTAFDDLRYNTQVVHDANHTTGDCRELIWRQPKEPTTAPPTTPPVTAHPSSPAVTPTSTPPSTPPAAPSSPVSHPSATPVSSGTPDGTETVGAIVTGGSLPITGTGYLPWLAGGGTFLVLLGAGLFALARTRNRNI